MGVAFETPNLLMHPVNQFHAVSTPTSIRSCSHKKKHTRYMPVPPPPLHMLSRLLHHNKILKNSILTVQGGELAKRRTKKADNRNSSTTPSRIVSSSPFLEAFLLRKTAHAPWFTRKTLNPSPRKKGRFWMDFLFCRQRCVVFV